MHFHMPWNVLRIVTQWRSWFFLFFCTGLLIDIMTILKSYIFRNLFHNHYYEVVPPTPYLHFLIYLAKYISMANTIVAKIRPKVNIVKAPCTWLICIIVGSYFLGVILLSCMPDWTSEDINFRATSPSQCSSRPESISLWISELKLFKYIDPARHVLLLHCILDIVNHMWNKS